MSLLTDWMARIIGRRKPGKGPAYPTIRPVVLDPWTRGVSDVSKLPTLPYFGYRFIYELFLYSDVLRVVIRSLVQETVRKGLIVVPRFAVKCTVCGTEYDTQVHRCSVCKADESKLREPNEYERRSVEEFIKDVNSNDQSLIDVITELDMDLNIYDNAFLAVTKDYFVDENGEIVGAKVREILRASPEIIEMIMDANGVHGRMDDGRLVMTCIEHRDMIQLVDEDKVESARCSICRKKLYVAYFRARKGSVASSESAYIYYLNGEILHIKKFTHGVGYGLSPIYSIWMKVLTLMKQDYFILTAYSLERPPKALLILKGNATSIEKAWNMLKEEARTNPHIIYPLIVEPTPGETGQKVAEYIDLTFSSKDIDFIAYRDEVRRTIGALYGVMPIFSGDTGVGAGLANEGLQIVVTNRAVEREQALINGKVLSWLAKQMGLNDWDIRLYPNEARDVVARIQRERMRIDNALSMQSLGYRARAIKTEDGIDFEFEELETGEEIPRGLPISGRRKPISERRLQRVEGEPEHGRPRIAEQRFEGEELARRPKTPGIEAFVVGEGGELAPVDEGKVAKQVLTVPKKYRRYIPESAIPILPEGTIVYRGPRGGLFIDSRQVPERIQWQIGAREAEEEETEEVVVPAREREEEGARLRRLPSGGVIEYSPARGRGTLHLHGVEGLVGEEAEKELYLASLSLFSESGEKVEDIEEAVWAELTLVDEDGNLEAVIDVSLETDEDKKAFKRALEEIPRYTPTEEDRRLDAELKRALNIYSTSVGDFNVVKTGWQLGAKKYKTEYVAAGVLGYSEWPVYQGLTKEQSLEINKWIWDKVLDKKVFDLDQLASEVVSKFGIDRSKAENIIRTEMANIFNKAREWAYETSTRVQKFVWVAQPDACEKCKEVERMAAGGVRLEELKALVKQVGGEYSREWTVHPMCRCTFVRKYAPRSGWERV